MLLSGLVHTLPLQADSTLAAGRPFHRRQLLGQTHHLSLADHSAPQPRAYVHAGADGVLGPEGQAALADGVVALAWELLWAQEGLVGRVEKTLSWWGIKKKTRFKQTTITTQYFCKSAQLCFKM